MSRPKTHFQELNELRTPNSSRATAQKLTCAALFLTARRPKPHAIRPFPHFCSRKPLSGRTNSGPESETVNT